MMQFNTEKSFGKGFDMKIVIIGGGKIGFSLAEELANENHDIVLVDNDKEKVKMI